MAECKDCFHYNACSTMFEEALGLTLPFGEHSADRCNDFIPAEDVVPRAEVENYAEWSGLKQAKQDVAREIFEQIGEYASEFAAGYLDDNHFLQAIYDVRAKYTEEKT